MICFPMNYAVYKSNSNVEFLIHVAHESNSNVGDNDANQQDEEEAKNEGEHMENEDEEKMRYS